MIIFTKTAIGEHHIIKNIVCQDFSASYRDEERTIVTSCDGHGGAIYLRSDRGAKFASSAAIGVLKNINRKTFFRHRKSEICEQLRVQILCEWNALVERDLSKNPLKKSEAGILTDEQRFALKMDPVKAYGTTLNAAMFYGNKLICVSLGDGGCFLFRKGRLIPAFEEDDDDQVANITHSLCQENAGDYLNIEIFDAIAYDGVLLCTDGVINPYQNLENFEKSFAIPAAKKLLTKNESELADFIVNLGSHLGIGDDVTLSMMVKETASKRYYKTRR